MIVEPRCEARAHDFVGRIVGVDLRHQMSLAENEAIRSAIDNYAVLIFSDQAIGDSDQLAFAASFGPLERTSEALARSSPANQAGSDRLMVAGRTLTSQLWHSDSSYRTVPARYSILSGRVVPREGGDTEFADMRAAYDALSNGIKDELEGLIGIHDIKFTHDLLGFTDEEFEGLGLRRFPPVEHPLVRVHPSTGRKSLFLSSHVCGIRDWPRVEARRLVRELTEHATQPKFVYAHNWRKHDLVMWDNRSTMHRGRPYDKAESRQMHRSIVTDAPVLCHPGLHEEIVTRGYW